MKGSKPASNRDGSPVFDHCKDSLKETRVSFTRVSFTVQDGSWGKLKHEFMGVAASGAVVGGITSLLMNTRAYMEGELGVKELVKTVARDAAAGGAAAGTSYCIVRGCMYTITITCQSLMTDAVKASVQKAISEIVEHAGWDSDVSAFFFEAASDAARLTVQVAKGDVSTGQAIETFVASIPDKAEKSIRFAVGARVGGFVGSLIGGPPVGQVGSIVGRQLVSVYFKLK